MEFFGWLRWLDGRPLTSVIERYRARIFEEALYTFNDDGSPVYSMALTGRAKKNFKSCDLVLASFYRLCIWPTSPQGNDIYLIAADEGQAADDLGLAKLLVKVNPVLAREVQVLRKSIQRTDGRGNLTILPANDVAGSHGKTFAMLGVDECHTYRDWSILEALSPDPTRSDVLTWITTYDALEHREGQPLYDMLQQAKSRDPDPSMFFSWYSGTFTTDREHDRRSRTAEERANPSMGSWSDRRYLEKQKRRLPSHRYRRLHLNIGGQPEGAAFDADMVHSCIVAGRKSLKPKPGVKYVAACDPSGGSSDDFTCAIAGKHKGRLALYLVKDQAKKPPFDPRIAVRHHVHFLKQFGIKSVWGDRYAGQTFRRDFEEHGIRYNIAPMTASEAYERLEPLLNAGDVELLDVPKLIGQLLALTWRGRKIDHQPKDHDDLANAAALALVMANRKSARASDFAPMDIGEGDDDLPRDPTFPDPRWTVLHDPRWN